MAFQEALDVHIRDGVITRGEFVEDFPICDKIT